MSKDELTGSLDDIRRSLEHLRWRLMALIILLLILAQAVLSYFAYRSFEAVLAPQVHQQASIIGETVKDRLASAVELGMPADELVGVSAYFASILEDNPDIDYLAVISAEGRVLYSEGFSSEDADDILHDLQAHVAHDDERSRLTSNHYDTRVAIEANGDVFGVLHVGVERSFVQNELQEIVFDVLTVLVVSLLLVLELVLIFIALRIAMPMQLINQVLSHVASRDFTRRLLIRSNDEIGRFCEVFDRLVRRINQKHSDLVEEADETKAGQVNRDVVHKIDGALSTLKEKFRFAEPGTEKQFSTANALTIRAPLFLFMFSEELSRSFLPIYMQELYVPIEGVSTALVLGLPITIFMIVVALTIPFAGMLADRLGARNLFLLGIVPAALGYLGAGLAGGVVDFILSRSLSAVGYGMVFIAAQGYIAQHSGGQQRASGMAIFVGAVAAASICGPSIGGILADRVGFRLTFVLSTLIAIVAAIVVVSMLDNRRSETSTTQRPGMHDLKRLLTGPAFFSVTIFAAIPTKMLLSGFLFFLAPIYMFELGNSQSAIGRVMMVYGLTSVILTPMVARWSDQHQNHANFVAIGGLVAGVGMLAILVQESTIAIFVATMLMGLGHALTMAPQLAIVQQIGEESDTGLSSAAVISAFRVIERFGTMMGPVVAGLLLSVMGFRYTMACLGILVLVCAFLFIMGQRSRPAAEVGAT